MKKIVVASKNKGKIREIAEILKGYEIVSASDSGFTEEIEENGKTFYENALIKAMAVSKALNENALADDSGLCVDALKGAPGIYSARYSEEGTDEKNNAKLIENMKGVKNRKAKFCSAVVLYKTDGEIISGYGETEGEILYKKEGNNGFGYDPLFFSQDLKKSFGTATEEEKNAVSHRARALKELKEKLK